jgi:hypothetical protein
MHGIRKLLLGGAASALVLTSLALPAAASDTRGTLAVVNGWAGQKIDVCIGRKEKRTALPYGATYEQDVIGTGKKVLRFYKVNRRKTCAGTLIAKRRLQVTPGSDWTVVVTRRAPRVLVFDNTDPFLGEIPPRGPALPDSAYAIRHAAEFGASLKGSVWSIVDEQYLSPVPSLIPLWHKGDERTESAAPAGVFIGVAAGVSGQSEPVAQRIARFRPGVRYEYVLVGTKPGNARMALIRRGISAVSP